MKSDLLNISSLRSGVSYGSAPVLNPNQTTRLATASNKGPVDKMPEGVARVQADAVAAFGVTTSGDVENASMRLGWLVFAQPVQENHMANWFARTDMDLLVIRNHFVDHSERR